MPNSGICYQEGWFFRFCNYSVTYESNLPDTLIIAMKQCYMRKLNEQDIHCSHDDKKDSLNKDGQPEKHSYSQVPKCA
jgi:hypothetical protein